MNDLLNLARDPRIGSAVVAGQNVVDLKSH